jgi:hypothetical protein
LLLFVVVVICGWLLFVVGCCLVVVVKLPVGRGWRLESFVVDWRVGQNFKFPRVVPRLV